MERLLVEDHIKINSVYRRMKRNKVSYGVLVEHWRPFGFNLDVDDSRIDLVERKLRDQIILGEELPREILKYWKVEQGIAANLKIIYDALIETNVKDLAENIHDDFFKDAGTIYNPDYRGEGTSKPDTIQQIQIRSKRKSFWRFLKKLLLRKLEDIGAERSSTPAPQPIENFRQNKVYWIPDSTSLHFAACNGLYPTFMQLLQEYEDINNLRYLLHACVSDSSDDKDSVLESKLKIIEVLAKKNPSWLEERFEDCTPILQPSVHLKLLQALVHEGADINATSAEHGTVLHNADDEGNFHNTLEWALSHGFCQINFQASRTGLAPILHAIKLFGQIQKQTLKLFHESDFADFNTTDLSGYSALFHALWNSTSQEFIENLIDYGADVNHCEAGPDQINVAHAVLRYAEEWDAKDVLNKLQLVVAKGFNLISQKDANGKSAVDYAIKNGNIHDDIIDFVVKTEAKPPIDGNIDEFLFCKILEGASAQTISAIIDSGANVNHLLNPSKDAKQSHDEYTAAICVICALKNKKLNHAQALEILELLVSKGYSKMNHTSDIVEPGDELLGFTKLTPLMYAILLEVLDEKLLQFFHASGAEFNCKAKNNEGFEMPVLFLVLLKNLQGALLEKMIDCGSNVNIRVKTIEDGRICHTNICHMIIMSMHKADTPWTCAEVIKCFDLVGSNGLDFNLLNEKGPDSVTPVHYVVICEFNDEWDEREFEKLFEYLHKKGADFNVVDKNDETVVYKAIKNTFPPRVIKKIIKCGGDLYRCNNRGENAIQLAARLGVSLT